MDLIERENPSLRGVLPKTYARAEIDKRLLGELVDLIGTIGFTDVDHHDADDVLARVYEYFLGRFAATEGRNAGEFYTPRSVVRVLVEMLEPFNGRVFDPCCGSGGMFVQSAEFVAAHGGRRDDIAIYGQEFVATTWRLAKMNLALRGVDANLSDRADDAFHRDLAAEYIALGMSAPRIRSLAGNGARKKPSAPRPSPVSLDTMGCAGPRVRSVRRPKCTIFFTNVALSACVAGTARVRLPPFPDWGEQPAAGADGQLGGAWACPRLTDCRVGRFRMGRGST